jgi:hypothetical protein
MNLRIHQLAVAEIDREVDYYESRQSGLGTELEDETDAAFSLILQFPEGHRSGAIDQTGGWPYSIAFRSRFLTRSQRGPSWSSPPSHTRAVDRITGRDALPIDAARPSDA